jgi:hypothetical protein
MRWFTLGEDAKVSRDESRLASQLCTVLDTGDAEVLSVATLDAQVKQDTTLLVLERPTERILFIIRQDGSIVTATDTWCPL